MSFFCSISPIWLMVFDAPLGVCEHALDLGLEGRVLERAFDAHGNRKAGKTVGPAFAFGTGDDLRLGEEIEAARHNVDGPARL